MSFPATNLRNAPKRDSKCLPNPLVCIVFLQQKDSVSQCAHFVISLRKSLAPEIPAKLGTTVKVWVRGDREKASIRPAKTE